MELRPLKPSELACLAFLEALDGEPGVLPDGCDADQLQAEGLIRVVEGGRMELTAEGLLRLWNLRTQHRQYLRNL